MKGDLLKKALALLEEGRVLPLGEAVLVASSTPGKWYAVRRGWCACPGFKNHGRCKHALAAELAARKVEKVG
ncbi:hypothetical protein HRbin39_00118 [bacterium HR39]|nr:hypothetical protein HRbin39_00118 [bacterium HR39]